MGTEALEGVTCPRACSQDLVEPSHTSPCKGPGVCGERKSIRAEESLHRQIEGKLQDLRAPHPPA